MKWLYWGNGKLKDGRNVYRFEEVGAGGNLDFKPNKENYSKGHHSVNPEGIVPMGLWPNVEVGFEADLSKLTG